MTQTSSRLIFAAIPLMFWSVAATGQTASCGPLGVAHSETLFGEGATVSLLAFARVQTARSASLQREFRATSQLPGSHLPIGISTVCSVDLSEFDDAQNGTLGFSAEGQSKQIAKHSSSVMPKRF